LPSTLAAPKWARSRAAAGGRRLRWLRLLAFLFPFLLTQPALAYYIIGDSIGVGVGWAAPHASTLAANSIRISSNVIFGQIASVPRGSLVFVSLGTNDAVGYVVDVESWVQRIVDAANERNLTLIWIGPPCVFKSWDSAAQELDQHLATQLRSLGVTYVSMRDPSICDRSVRGSDGVHFSLTGYRRMWSIAATAVGLAPDTGLPDVPVPQPVPNPIRVAGTNLDRTTTAAVTPEAAAPERTATEPVPSTITNAVLAAMAATPPQGTTQNGATDAVPIPMPRPPFVQQVATTPPIPIPNPIRQNVAIGY
jgi:hypothetical protein